MTRRPFALPAEVGAAVFVEQAAAGGADPRNLDPNAMAVKTFHVRFNERELLLMQMCADLANTSKQRFVRQLVREHCERKLRAAGVPFPGRT